MSYHLYGNYLFRTLTHEFFMIHVVISEVLPSCATKCSAHDPGSVMGSASSQPPHFVSHHIGSHCCLFQSPAVLWDLSSSDCADLSPALPSFGVGVTSSRDDEQMSRVGNLVIFSCGN